MCVCEHVSKVCAHWQLRQKMGRGHILETPRGKVIRYKYKVTWEVDDQWSVLDNQEVGGRGATNNDTTTTTSF